VGHTSHKLQLNLNSHLNSICMLCITRQSSSVARGARGRSTQGGTFVRAAPLCLLYKSVYAVLQKRGFYVWILPTVEEPFRFRVT